MSGAGDSSSPSPSPSPSPEAEVEVNLRAIGPSRPTSLRLPSLISVGELRRRVAAERRLPSDRLKLVLRGKTLVDSKGEGRQEVQVRLLDGDNLVVAVVPKPPAKHLRDDDDDDDDGNDEDLKFHIPQTTSLWKRRIFTFLHQKLGVPDIVLMAIFSISLKAWTFIVLLLALAPVAYRWDILPLYILGSGFLIILVNLGRRQQGDVSAYSIFNEDFRELPGTFNANMIDRDLRAGRF